jgi:cytochrome b
MLFHKEELNLIKVWSLPTRLLHWVLACSFAVAFYTATSEMMRNIHVYAGYIAGAVIVVRWFYGFLMKDFSAFRRFPPNLGAGFAYITNILTGKAKRYLGHNPAGALAIYAILTLGSFTIITGYMSFNEIVLPFGLIDEDRIKDFHKFVADAWLGVVGLHIIGVVVGSLAHRENLVLAMITGYKRRRLPDIGRFSPPVTAGVEISDELRMQYIEEAAYYIAERKGFQGEHSWDDWLQAEKEVERMLKKLSNNNSKSYSNS